MKSIPVHLAIAILFLIVLYYLSFLSPLPSTPLISPRPTTTPILTKPTPTNSPTITIGLVGDLGLGRMITRIARQKNDFSYSFSGVSSWLTKNDLNIANLESVITSDCPTLSPTTFFFCGDSKFLPQLSQNKFLLNLSNNHILNFGQSGLTQTQQFLTDSQIPFVYSHQSQTEFTQQTINGINIGILGYDLTNNHQINQSDILAKVKQYDPKVDWLIVSLHWGAEYLPQPESWRVTFAKQLIDSGADIIHGHHPHVWQPPQTYKDKVIYYSLGNFIFDQNWSQKTSQSNIVRLTLSKNKIISTDTFPIQITNNSRPVLVSD